MSGSLVVLGTKHRLELDEGAESGKLIKVNADIMPEKNLSTLANFATDPQAESKRGLQESGFTDRRQNIFADTRVSFVRTFIPDEGCLFALDLAKLKPAAGDLKERVGLLLDTRGSYAQCNDAISDRVQIREGSLQFEVV
jgi:hypothetical protein